MKTNKFESIMTMIFSVFAIIMFGYLFACSLFKTGINSEYIDIEYITLINDNIFINILKIVVFVGLIILLLLTIKKIDVNKRVMMFLIITMILVSCVSVFIINNIMSGPQADQKEICEFAHFFNEDKWYGFNPGEYISTYPQQLGLISIMRLVFILFGDYNYNAFQYINALATSLIVLSGYIITKYLSDNSVKARYIYLLLSIFCVPMYLYTAFIYGEILSTTCVLLATSLLFIVLNKNNIWIAIVYGILMAFSIMIKPNCYIALIAHGIVLVIKYIQDKKSIYILCIISMIGFTIFSQVSTNQYYLKYMKNKDSALPKSVYVAVGLSDSGQSPGWFGGYDFSYFKKLNYDSNQTNSIACNDIKNRITEFVQHPRYALDFFNRKLQTQWNSPMYQCIHMNSYITEAQSKFGEDLYYGNTRNICEQLMKAYQLCMYGSILFLLINKRKIWSIEKYILLIVVFGGFLFSIIWEAKSRYIFPYMLMMIPYFATGLEIVLNKIAYNKK